MTNLVLQWVSSDGDGIGVGDGVSMHEQSIRFQMAITHVAVVVAQGS